MWTDKETFDRQTANTKNADVNGVNTVSEGDGTGTAINGHDCARSIATCDEGMMKEKREGKAR
jgi:hypothetical protein